MIRHKAMFKAFLIISALCLGTLSEAGTCIWCDDEVSRVFLNCLFQKMEDNPIFTTSASQMEEMKNDLLEAAEAIKTRGPAKDSVMKGAVAYTIVDIIFTGKNLDEKSLNVIILNITEIINQCYRAVHKRPDKVYIDELVGTIKNRLAENGDPSNAQQPNDHTQSDEIPQVGQNTNLPQYDKAPPQPAAAGPNQGKYQWGGSYGNSQQQGQNFQLNPSPAFSTANIYSTSTFQQQPASPQYSNAPPQQAAADQNEGKYLWNGLYGNSKQQGQTFQSNPNPAFSTANTYASSTFQQQSASPQYYNAPPQKAATIPNQGKNQWDGLYGKNQQQGQNIQPKLSQSNINTFALTTANTYDTSPFQLQSASPNNVYLLNEQQKQPFSPFNTNNNQGNSNAYQNTYQSYPLNNANSNTGANSAFPSYAYSGSQSNDGYNPPYSGSSTSAASQTAYNGPQKNYDYGPNNPASYAETTSSASSSVTNDGRSNAAASSSGSYSIENSNQKPLFNRRKRKQKLVIPDNGSQSGSIVSLTQNQQNTWDNNQNLYPVIQNTPITQPEPVKTNSVPQQTIPIDTQNAAQDNNWKITNQKNVPSTKDDKVINALKFSEFLFIILKDNYYFKNVFHPRTTVQQVNNLVPLMMYNGLSSCGYDEKSSQELATSSISFTKGFPVGSPTSSYAEAFCKMTIILFEAKNMIGDDPHGQATALGNAMCAALKKIISPPPLQDNDTKFDVLPASQQNLPHYATKNIPYDDGYPNFDAANPQVNPDSFSNKQLNQQPDSSNKGSDNPFPQTLPTQNQQNQPNVYNGNDQPTDDKAISYDKTTNNKANKEADQSYYDADDKPGKDYDDNCDDDSPDQSQIQKQKKQSNTNDNSNQSSDDKPISYDKTANNSKGDQSYADDKTAYSNNNQTPNDKQNKKGYKPNFSSSYKGGDSPHDYDSPNEYYDGYYEDDYYGDDYYGDDYYGDDYYDLTNTESKGGDINPNDYLIQKKNSKNNKQADNYPDTLNVPGDNSKAISKSKKQKNKSTPQYLPDFDKDGSQNPTTQLPYISDDQQTSKTPDIGQQTNKAPIKPNTLKDSDNQTVLSTNAPVFQPNTSDNSMNPDLKQAQNAESKDRVEILKKSALDCMKDGKFDYKVYSRVIASLAKVVQGTNPKWSAQKSQTTVLIETIFALTQLLVKSNKEVKDTIQQPQKSIEPVQLPPNSQQNNQNVPQQNQNPNYQTGQTNQNSQFIQDNPVVNYLAPEQSNLYSPQNQGIQQNKWDNNPNSYPVMQNIPIAQRKPMNTNSFPQQTIPMATQNAAQDNSWNIGNQEWQNNLGQINKNDANSQQVGQQSLFPGQINTNEGGFAAALGNVAPIIPNGPSSPNLVPIGNQAFGEARGNWNPIPNRQNNPGFFQNGNLGFAEAQGNWPPILPNGPNNPSSIQNGNHAYAEAQSNSAPISNRPSNPSSEQNRNQGFTGGRDSWNSVILNGPNNRNLVQNGNLGFPEAQGNWVGPSNPSLVQNTNQGFVGGQGNSAISNGPSDPSFPQNGYQGNWAASQQNNFRQFGN